MSQLPRYPASEAEWAQHQEAIIQLYYWDKLSLSQVMMKMSKLHGFKATVKMYKTRIKAWGLTKYTKRSRKPRGQRLLSSKPTLEAAVPGRERQVSKSVNFDVAETVPHDMTNAPIVGISVPNNGLCHTIAFDRRIDHFLRATMVYLQFAAERESWRSIPSLLVSRRSIPSRLTSHGFQVVLNGPVLEWKLNAFDRESCGLEGSFFNDIMTSVCYAARADYENAGDCWRLAFIYIEKAIDTEDPELLVALMWSVTLLDRSGCGKVVVMLQDHVLHLIRLRAKVSDPLIPVLASFARIHHTRMMWVRGLILNIVLDWATALSRDDASLFTVYSWSSLPSAEGFMSIALTRLRDFKNTSDSDMGLVGPHGKDYIGERLIFMSRKKRGL